MANKYPPFECTIPLGTPVEPDVNNVNNSLLANTSFGKVFFIIFTFFKILKLLKYIIFDLLKFKLSDIKLLNFFFQILSLINLV